MSRDTCAEPYGLVVRLPGAAEENRQLHAQVAKLQAQVTELQTRMTAMVEEKRAHRARVMQFRKAFGLPVNHDAPKVPADERVRLHLRLVCEEFFELLGSAFPNKGRGGATGLHEPEGDVMFAINNWTLRVDLPEFADALADLDYVVEGARQEFGIIGEPVAEVVHASNMAKVGGVVREDGKILKSANWVAPDIAGELRRQGWTP